MATQPKPTKASAKRRVAGVVVGCLGLALLVWGGCQTLRWPGVALDRWVARDRQQGKL
jgi:hypothetical protein